ncbi:MAG: S-layer homology domain-containing protein [Peptococcaceae bacterium]|nr:S-layer homology domain-containing protein [Peptococcaceae bacterium]
MRKRILSILLSVCMMLTMLPISAMAEGVDSSIGMSGEIIAFAPLAETEKSVPTGKAIEDLEFPETLTATVRTAVAADSGTAEEPVQDSGNSDKSSVSGNLTVATTGSDIKVETNEPQKQEKVEEAVPRWEEKTAEIPVTWTAEPEYNGNENGVYVFKPEIEGYTVSADLPEITVTVGTQPLRMALRTGTSVTYGDFSVSIDEDGVAPTYTDGILTFGTAGEYTIGMAGGNDSTSDVIVVNATGEVKLNLDGVNITAPMGLAYRAGSDALTVTSGTVTLNVIANSSLTGGIGGPDGMNTAPAGNGGAGVIGDVRVTGTATLTVTGGCKGTHQMFGTDGLAGMGIIGNVNVSGTATLIASSGSGMAGMAISNAAKNNGGTITVGEGYTVVAGADANTALPTDSTSTIALYVAITPPPVLPAAEAYAEGATSPTDYDLDTGNKTLTIKTAKGAAFWSANGASYLDYTILLADDINVSGFLWTPVGNAAGSKFEGSFDGQGHSISGLTITAANNEYAGLFGGAFGATIQNLCVSGTIEVTETDELYIGGIAGCLGNSSTIRNCCSHVGISGTANSVSAGGIVGLLNSGAIENCFNTGAVSGTGANRVIAGGIYGEISTYRNNIGTVKNSYNTGSVTGSGSGSSMVGALGGGAASNIVLENCYYLSGTASAAFGYGSDSNGTSFTSGGAGTLLAALNGWVAAEDSADYRTWTADNATPLTNSGYPVFAAVWGTETPIFVNCFGRVKTAKDETPNGGIEDYGYIFSGWYTAPNGEGTKLGDTDPGTIGTHYYAKWTHNGHTVRTTALDLRDISESKLYGSGKSGDVYTNAAEGWTWYAAETTVSSETYAANTLVLSGLTLHTAASAALSVPDGTTVVAAEGMENRVWSGYTSSTDEDAEAYGIYGADALNIRGGGTLNVLAGSANSVSGYSSSIGIFSKGDLTISDAVTVTARGNSAAGGDNSMSAGISSDTEIVVSGGTVSATGNSADASIGIYCGYDVGNQKTGTIVISGGTVTATGGTVPNGGTSIGLVSIIKIAISGGTVAATGGSAGSNGSSIGMYGSNDDGDAEIVISGGRVTAKSGSEGTSMAVYADGTLTVGSSDKIAAIENATDGSGTITTSSGEITSKTLVMSGINPVEITFTTYAITANSATHGSYTVKVNGSPAVSAQLNDTVTITPTASSGYELDTISVCKTGDSGTTVTVTNGSFTMPDYAVTVNVTFKVNSTPTYTISGTIKGSDTSAGIPASLQLKNSSGNVGNVVTAAADGSYSITGVPAGSYTIAVSYAGYDSGTITGITVSNAAITGANLTLTKSGIGLTDAQKLAAAQAAIMAAINRMSFSNSTTAADILSVAQAASLYGVTVAWDTANGFTKTQATASAKGSIRGTLKLTLNQESDGIGIDATIAKLSTGGDNGGGGSDSGGSTPPPSTKPTEPVTGSTENKATVDNKGNASVSLTDKNITDAIANAKAEAAKKGVNAGEITAVIHVTTGGKNADTVTVNLPKTTQEQVIGNKIASVQLVIDRPDLTIGIDLAAVTEINRQAKADVQLSATRMDNTKLSGDAKAAIGNRPAYDLKTFYGNGKSVTDFGKGSVSVEIPYTLQKGELAGNVYAVYVDSKGKVTYLTDSSYDAKRGTVVFSTSHFSTYGVAYKASFKFTDINGHWAKDDILFVANRGLMTGTSATTFSPNGSMTRGMFVTALGRLANADISAYKQSGFTDVKADAYYMGYIEWGVKNNILVGIGGGKFDPDGLVTREQMAVIMDRYATAIGFKLPEVHTQNVFADNAKIGAWAAPSVKRVQMAGIIQGKSNNLYDPQGTATRAEVSAVLRRFVEVAIFSDTAQGWTMNDSGKWMYYENGKPVIGKKDIDGSTYTFDQYGVTSDVPKNLRYTTYTVQKGDSFWSIARKLDCTISELERLNNKSRFSIIHPGDVLRVPEK